MKKYLFFELLAVSILVAIPLLSHAQCDSNALTESPAFKATKKWPLHPEITINATVTFQEGSSYSSPEDKMGLYDIYLELSNTKDGKKIAKLCQKGALSSDAISLNSISIDTAPYVLSKTMRAFGVRASYANNSRSNPASVGTITLFGLSAGKIRPLLKTTDTGGHFNEISLNEECQGTYSESNLTIAISANQHNGLSDLLLTKVENEGELIKTPKDCVEQSSNRKITKSTLTFNGFEYH
ncbi:MAG: hypothetical protein V4525_13435 [Pseudomonadota bacterium]